MVFSFQEVGIMIDFSTSFRTMFILIELIMSLGLTHEQVMIDGYEQQVYTIEASLNQGAQLIQELAHNSLLGYDHISAMAVQQEYSYPLGVNGMFYNGYGRPQGIVIKNYELISLRSVQTPTVLVYSDGDIALRDIELRAYLVHNEVRQPIYEINDDYYNRGVGVYTQWFGKYLYPQENIRIYRIDNNEVSEIVTHQERIVLEGNTLNQERYYVSRKIFSKEPVYNVGDSIHVDIESNVDIENVKDAFQTGGWLVYDGDNVAKDYEAFIGYTTSLQPRTAIGITEQKKIIIKVIDGRQPGISRGVTGKQLATLMQEAGCMYAAYLDGGSSSVITHQAQVINQPSTGEEKPVAHGIYFHRTLPKELQK